MQRLLSEQEINILELNGCQAEDWTAVSVSEDFTPDYLRNVMFYGDVSLGVFERTIEVTPGFSKHSGIRNATLRNVTIGDNCLIENIGNYINNYTIGANSYISNVCVMETIEGATFGQGNVVSVLNEVGEGNIMLFGLLNSQFAAFMVKHHSDHHLRDTIYRLIREEINCTMPDRGTIGERVKIVNTKEIINSVIGPDCEISGASRLSDCTLQSVGQPVYIGTGVICENSIISDGSSVINSVKMQDCFVGEACKISNGFTASQSIFFANSYMSNGEACAAFCGPFTASHHKSSLLIGGQFSFYNAGSATNFSNHAYTMYLSPGRNLTTVGLYRDIRKWPKRDIRPLSKHRSIVNFDWLSPFSVNEVIQGKAILERLREASGDNVSTYNYHEYVINASSLRMGISHYDMALRIYMGAVVKRVLKRYGAVEPPASTIGEGAWSDLSGLLLPESEEQRLIEQIKDGTLDDVQSIIDEFVAIDSRYRDYQWAWTYRLILDYYHIDHITQADIDRIHTDYVEARRMWISEIRKDAEKEFNMGDVEREVFDDFINLLDHEIDYEN